MAFLEWRKFNFFDLKANVDDGRIASLYKECDITVATSGNNQAVLGDSCGQIHIITRFWQVTTFRAYEFKVSLAKQLRSSPLLVTVGDDDVGINPLIKVWNTTRFDKNGIPYCCRVSRAIPGVNPVAVTTLCVHEELQLMAIGFMDGSLNLYRGEITRDRGSKQKVFRVASCAITGLAFQALGPAVFLFVATESSVYMYNITHKDKEHKISLDNMGCAKNCSVLAVYENLFMIGRNNAIYCYTIDGKGPCYAVDGEKVLLEWFRNYLVIVSTTNRPITQAVAGSSSQPTSQGHLITVLDIHNKFIVFSSVMEKVRTVFSEWGSFYIIDYNNNVYHLDEKDLQSKLALLFKKNLYDLAIRIAKSQQYDSYGLVDIYRQYGDHLYAKGGYEAAIEQYIKTIGRLEPSYVIRKFLDSQHIEYLTTYLQALHKQGQAPEDHTTLLLNCYTKLNNTDSLKEFILTKDNDLDFDVEIAIKVCRYGSPEEALMLAKKHAKHDWYIKIQIEDHEKYIEALQYISRLDFQNAENFMKKYGNILIEKEPHESTQFLKRLCTNYRPVDKTDGILNGITELNQNADAEDYIHLFLNNSERLVEFLEYLISEGCVLSSPVYDTLIEHYLHVWSALEAGPEKAKYTQKILKLLQTLEVKYDKPQALVVCHMHGFSEGIFYLYEEQKLYPQILRYHVSKGDESAVLACCRRFGHQEPSLWVQALWSCVRESNSPLIDILPEILTVIAKERLLSPQQVIEAIGIAKSDVTLGHIRSYITNELQKEHDIIENNTELIDKYQTDIEKLKQQVETLKNGVVVIQGSRCAACHHQLELPSLHFLCQHSFHHHCFQSFAENENECPACLPENKKLIELLKSREYNKDLHETFHSQLEKASDGFSLAAEYFGRSVFNKITVITDDETEKILSRAKKYDGYNQYNVLKAGNRIEESAKSNYGPSAEARIRLSENIRNTPKIISTSEGKMRLQEHQYSQSLEANITKYGTRGSSSKKSESDSQVIGKNPFEDDYDDSKNPFTDDEFDETNPFSDQYDKNLNPFEP
ncbi:vacuolar protein sorting-associated protein 11 homolog [Agrilus planipennis]|uniref:Vacuolar protein sorting-associated protein 11 homolog n=1 Tax=Agrilus planipennis TaxID=224129 RepID=A0A1W4XGV5_AGRPL|nr:vacuolar protein sorting-associated protein 11 homolog [Agrilus planipennis]